jgi:putative FmdB family regulatory protein
MPTYEYACRDCGEHLEVVQSFKDDPLTQCPSCTGELRKVFSAAGIIFKGSGWHIKDYASTGSSSSSGSSSKDAETSGSSSKDAATSGSSSGSDGSSDAGTKTSTASDDSAKKSA